MVGTETGTTVDDAGTDLVEAGPGATVLTVPAAGPLARVGGLFAAGPATFGGSAFALVGPACTGFAAGVVPGITDLAPEAPAGLRTGLIPTIAVGFIPGVVPAVLGAGPAAVAVSFTVEGAPLLAVAVGGLLPGILVEAGVFARVFVVAEEDTEAFGACLIAVEAGFAPGPVPGTGAVVDDFGTTLVSCGVEGVPEALVLGTAGADVGGGVAKVLAGAGTMIPPWPGTVALTSLIPTKVSSNLMEVRYSRRSIVVLDLNE